MPSSLVTTTSASMSLYDMRRGAAPFISRRKFDSCISFAKGKGAVEVEEGGLVRGDTTRVMMRLKPPAAALASSQCLEARF